LLDLLDTAQDDQPYARQQLLKFIDSKPKGTRFAVFVLSDGLHLVQGFTADRGQLHAVLDPSHAIPHVPQVFLFKANYQVSMFSVFRNIALYLDGISGRKNIIWYSEGFQLELFPRDGDPPDQRKDLTEMLDALTRAECSIYPVDVSGVSVFPAGRLTGGTTSAAPSNGAPGAPGATLNVVPGGSQATLNPPGAWAFGTAPLSGAGGGPLIAQMAAAGAGNVSPRAIENVEDAVADFTGGRAFYSRNDFANALEEATEDGANYYTLTYSPSDLNYGGKLRNISVRLTIPKKHYNLEYRRGYLATAPESPIMPIYHRRKEDRLNQGLKLRPVGDSLSAYMQHGAPIARDVYFQAHVQAASPLKLATAAQMDSLVDQPTYFRFRQKKHPNKALPPVQLQTYLIEYEIIGRSPSFEVAAGVYDGESRLLNGDVEETTSSSLAGGSPPSNPQTEFAYFRVQQKIEVPVGAAWLRLAVRDTSTDHMGTMEIALPLAPEPNAKAELVNQAQPSQERSSP
jgi:VWFA-related protein